MNKFEKVLIEEYSNITEGLLIWISEFCGSKGLKKTKTGYEFMWYLKEDAEKLYEGVNDKKLKLYNKKEIMKLYYEKYIK